MENHAAKAVVNAYRHDPGRAGRGVEHGHSRFSGNPCAALRVYSFIEQFKAHGCARAVGTALVFTAIAGHGTDTQPRINPLICNENALCIGNQHILHTIRIAADDLLDFRRILPCRRICRSKFLSFYCCLDVCRHLADFFRPCGRPGRKAYKRSALAAANGRCCLLGTVQQTFPARIVGVHVNGLCSVKYTDACAMETLAVHLLQLAATQGQVMIDAILHEDLRKIAACVHSLGQNLPCNVLIQHDIILSAVNPLTHVIRDQFFRASSTRT